MYIIKQKNQQSLRSGRKSMALVYRAYMHGIYIESIIQSSIINKELINIGLSPRALYQVYTQPIHQTNPTKTLTIYTIRCIRSVQAQYMPGLIVQDLGKKGGLSGGFCLQLIQSISIIYAIKGTKLTRALTSTTTARCFLARQC